LSLVDSARLSLPFDDLTAVADFFSPSQPICSRSNQARPGVHFHPQLHLQQTCRHHQLLTCRCCSYSRQLFNSSKTWISKLCDSSSARTCPGRLSAGETSRVKAFSLRDTRCHSRAPTTLKNLPSLCRTDCAWQLPSVELSASNMPGYLSSNPARLR
jgi:hypothetical protein